MTEATVLVLDTASPVVSLAIARRGEVLAEATLELRRTSERLLQKVQNALAEADCKLSELDGVASLQGPGSFTGLRIGLATVLGWHQGLGLHATAIPTLPVLAMSQANAFPGSEGVAAVDAMRGDWMVQPFRLPDAGADGTPAAWPTPLAEPQLLSQDDLVAAHQAPVVGFELPKLDGLTSLPAPPLAPVAARWLSDVAGSDGSIWQSERLIDPIYFRPPAVTLPKRKAP